ncbi:toxin-antitoxin system YwqK family antitoxin [Geopseudomonas aromaticivorans]
MKKLIPILLAVTTLTGCKTEIDHAEVELRNNLIYKYGETDPFTGTVLNTPAGLPGINAACNSQIEKGRHSGKSECFYNSQKVYEVEYLAGRKDGTEVVFDAKSGAKISVKNWKNGRLHGKSEEYQNGALTHQQEFKDGKPDEKETRWSNDGKQIITELTWSAGNKFNGYEADSEGKRSYLNGQLHGPQIKYGHLAGGLKQYVAAEENYSNGKLDGAQKKYTNILHTEIVQQESEIVYANGTAISGWVRRFSTPDGQLIQEIKLAPSSQQTEDDDFYNEYPGNLVPVDPVQPYNFQTGQLEDEDTLAAVVKVSSPSPNSPSTSAESCLDAWIAAYRSEVGEDAPIVSEQLGEWEEWCGEGKTP